MLWLKRGLVVVIYLIYLYFGEQLKDTFDGLEHFLNSSWGIPASVVQVINPSSKLLITELMVWLMVFLFFGKKEVLLFYTRISIVFLGSNFFMWLLLAITGFSFVEYIAVWMLAIGGSPIWPVLILGALSYLFKYNKKGS